MPIIPVLAHVHVRVLKANKMTHSSATRRCSTLCPFYRMHEEGTHCSLFDVELSADKRCKECLAAESRETWYDARVPNTFDRM